MVLYRPPRPTVLSPNRGLNPFGTQRSGHLRADPLSMHRQMQEEYTYGKQINLNNPQHGLYSYVVASFPAGSERRPPSLAGQLRNVPWVVAYIPGLEAARTNPFDPDIISDPMSFVLAMLDSLDNGIILTPHDMSPNYYVPQQGEAVYASLATGRARTGTYTRANNPENQYPTRQNPEILEAPGCNFLSPSINPASDADPGAASTPAAPPPEGFNLRYYRPDADETVALFAQAAADWRLPTAWANAGSGVHYIMDRESSGYVGRPNYTFNGEHEGEFRDHYNDPAHRNEWFAAGGHIEQIRNGGRRRDDDHHPDGRYDHSDCSGLGQLTVNNVEDFYPSGVAGVGIAYEEAVGMLRYIAQEYNNPEQARLSYNLPPCCTANQGFMERMAGRGVGCIDHDQGDYGRRPAHINWLAAGCKTHEGY